MVGTTADILVMATADMGDTQVMDMAGTGDLVCMADMGDTARSGRVNDMRGAGPQTQVINHLAQFRDFGGQVKRRVVDGSHDQIAADVYGSAAD